MAKKRTGRPAKYDRDAVLDSALALFWTKGFDQTSLSELESATSVDRSTIYKSFGGKRGLYDVAAERYVDNVVDHVFGALRTGDSDDLTDLHVFLETLEVVTRSAEYPPGCLIVGDLGSPSRSEEQTRRYFAMLHDGIRAAFDRAGHSEAEAEHQTVLLVAAIVGVNAVAARDRDGGVAIIRALHTAIETLQSSHSEQKEGEQP